MKGKRLGIDVGGTFVDFVLLDETTGEVRIEKEPSTPEILTERILSGIRRLKVEPAELDMILHASTIVVNLIIQERGDPVGLITTQGFRDVLELGFGNRPEVYNFLYKPPKPLVPRYLRYEVTERMDYQGGIVKPLDEESVRSAVENLKSRGVAGIAISLLHAYANPVHERRVRQIIQDVYPEVQVAISSEVIGEFREYERTSTTVLNVYTMPRMTADLDNLERQLADAGYEGTLNIMQSNGGMIASSRASHLPIRTVESGPGGGVIGAAAIGTLIGEPNLITADVGGTSFDVALIVDGQPSEKSESHFNGRPVLQPTVDVTSIGAGCGSIAWLDAGDALHVGPQSAEADPGPVCFGKGGTQPTVTDAQVILGRINPNFFLGQRMHMHVELARSAIQKKIAEPLSLTLEEAAAGILYLANTNMINAIRERTIERGFDPRDFAVLCVGGGGGLFAGALAQELEIPRAVIPPAPAVFSAWGILNADFREDVTRTYVTASADLKVNELEDKFEELEKTSLEKLRRNGLANESVRFIRAADMRYVGQEHTVRVPLSSISVKDLGDLERYFDKIHERIYEHALPGTPTELVSLRVAAIHEMKKPSLQQIRVGEADSSVAVKESRPIHFEGVGGAVDCRVYDREKFLAGNRIDGPAIVEEWNSTVIVFPGQHLVVDAFGNLIIHIA